MSATNVQPTEPVNNGKTKVQIGVKSFILMVCILLAVVIAAGVLTFVIPAGKYYRYELTDDQTLVGTQDDTKFVVYTDDVDKKGQVVPDSYIVLPQGSSTRLPVWRWITAPFESLIWGNTDKTFPASINVNEISILALLLVLGGTFKVLEKSIWVEIKSFH